VNRIREFFFFFYKLGNAVFLQSLEAALKNQMLHELSWFYITPPEMSTLLYRHDPLGRLMLTLPLLSMTHWDN